MITFIENHYAACTVIVIVLASIALFIKEDIEDGNWIDENERRIPTHKIKQKRFDEETLKRLDITYH